MGEGLNAPCPHSLFFELMDFTCELSKSFNLSPFDVLQQDKDEVIMFINYFIEKGQEVSTSTSSNKTKNVITVSSKNDGFWDF